jgi:DNA-binding protein YbaB
MIDIDKVLESKDSLEEIQRLLASSSVTGSTPSGKIQLVITCDKTLQEVIIDPSLRITSSDQVIALCKALLVAFNDADKKIAIQAADLITAATEETN